MTITAANDAIFPTLDVTSLRIGAATNSSSSHSIIMHSSAGLAARIAARGPERPGAFGWSDFVLTSAADKLRYAACSNRRLIASTSAHEKALVMKRLHACGVGGDILAELQHDEDYIDHDSAGVASVPHGLDLSTWLAMLANPSVVIYGGNDNTEFDLFAYHRDAETVAFSSATRWRRDGAAVIGHCPKTGAKIRLSPEPYAKSSVPELVDLKITDYCAYGCSFCYQGSTTAGEHAPLGRVLDILSELSRLGVFEVAIGGGEPTTHPQFKTIAEHAINLGISFNFTSFGTDWAKDNELLDILKRASNTGVGVSVHGPRDIQKLKEAREALQAARAWSIEPIAQTVVGAASMTTIEKTVDKAIEEDMPILLLGYKTTGRGGAYRRKASESARLRRILEKVRAHLDGHSNSEMRLSVDTAFLDQHGDVLDDLGAPNLLRASPEGAFSCYIDAVTGMIGPSSYAGDDAMAPIVDIKAQFSRY